MLTSLEEAHRLLNKWMSERSLLNVILSHEGIKAMFFGTLNHVSSSELALTGGIGGVAAFGELIISLEGATFEYSDPRSGSSLFPGALIGSAVAGFLEVLLPSGAKCLICEIDLQSKRDSTTSGEGTG